MTVQNPSLPGSGIAVRVLRDDGKTYIGAVVPVELYTAGFAANAIRNSAGISATEIARLGMIQATKSYTPARPPIIEGPGWAVFHGSMVTAAIARDDGVSYLSYTVDPGNYNASSVSSVLAAIPGLTASELARAKGIGGGVISGGTPTPTPSGNAALLAALPAKPLTAIIGASLEGYGRVGSGGTDASKVDECVYVWGEALGAPTYSPIWGDTSAESNAYGYNFGSPSTDLSGMLAKQFPAVYNSDAKLIIFNMSRNDWDGTGTVDSNTSRQKAIMLDAISRGFAVVMQELFEQASSETSAPYSSAWTTHNWASIWLPGASQRPIFAQIVAEMNNFCAANGIPVIPLRDALTFVDANGDRVYKPGISSDGKHLSSLGGYIGGKTVRDFLVSIGIKSAAAYDPSAAGNLVTNASLTGTDGTLTNGMTGQLPTGVSGSRRTSADVHTSNAVIETINGVNAISINATLSGAISAPSEGDSVVLPITGLVSGNWYRARLRMVHSTSNASRRASRVRVGNSADGQMWDGFSSQTGAGTNNMVLTSEGYVVTRDIEFKAAATTAGMTVTLEYTQDAGPVKTSILLPRVEQISDPTTSIGPFIQFPPASKIITTGTSDTLDLTTALNTTRTQPTIVWSKVSGAASMTITDSTVTFTAPAYDASGANNSYSATFRATYPNGKSADVVVTRQVSAANAFRKRAYGTAANFAAAADAATPANVVAVEPAGVVTGDLLVAAISYRDTPTFTVPAGWTAAAHLTGGNTSSGGTTAQANLLVCYIVRGASPPDLTFTRVGGSIGRIQVSAYYNPAGISVDAISSAVLASGATTVTTAALTTTKTSELIYVAAASGRTADYTSLAATSPSVAAGNATDSTSEVTDDTFLRRTAGNNGTVPQCALNVWDAIKPTVGDTGVFTAVNGSADKHAMVAIAFKRNT